MLGDQRLKTLEHKARDALPSISAKSQEARRHVAQQRRPKVAAIAAAGAVGSEPINPGSSSSGQ